MNPEVDRRVVAGAALAAVALVTDAVAEPPSYTPQTLSLDPARVAGLSEKLLRSHYDNNYIGAVRRLGAVEAQFKALDPAAAPGFQLNGLKREELIAFNSMVLHEIYFAGLAGEARAPGATLGARIERDFGSLTRWRAEFAGMAKALGGGSGWVSLTWSARAGKLINTWAADHTMRAAEGATLLAIDMYEHAYAMDYGARAGAYVDAFMEALRWDAANRAFAAATRA